MRLGIPECFFPQWKDRQTMAAPALQQSIRPGTWTLDPAPSTASFAVRSLAGTVTGTIPITSATVQVGADGAVGRVSAVLNSAGFHTGNPKRDNDVRSTKFLDSKAHPTLSFSATKAVAGTAGWTIDGNLMVKGTTTPVGLTAEVVDVSEDLVSVRASGVVDRRQAGLTKLPNLMIARMLKITLDVTFRHAT
jgi:polyisoprenoid-binding protein YceI